MRKNKLLSTAAAVLLLGSLALSACSSGSTGASEASEPETVSSTDTVETEEALSSTETTETESADAEPAAETEASETAAEDTTAETEAAENSWDEALQNMLMPMDALMMSAVEEGHDFDPADPEFFWSSLYRELCIYSDASSLITTTEDEEIQVPRMTAQEFATGLFAAYSDLPEIPDTLSSSIRYDESWDAYILSPGDRGLSAPEILSASETEDGGYDVTARLYDITDSSDICVYRFHLVPNTYADGITDPLFLYSVESMSVQE